MSFRASPRSISATFLLTKWNDIVVLTKKLYKCYTKRNESPKIFVGMGGGEDVMLNHDADSEACLNRQILHNSVKRKAVKDLCERPRKLKHRDSQYLDTVTYRDIRNISRYMHKTRPSQLLPLPTDIEETHEALCAVQALTSSTELAC